MLFALYSVVKPLSSCLILVVMYFVVTLANPRPELFAFMFVGNAFFQLVMGSLHGLSMVLHIEREHYQTLKYVYLATSNLYVYLFGRGAARMIITCVAVLITLLFGLLVFRLPLHLTQIDFPLLLISLILGLVSIVSFGLILAAISMRMAMHNFFISESFSALFFFLSGVLYPVSAMPQFLQRAALMLPFTYWMEMIRRALIPAIHSDPVMAAFSTPRLLEIFSVVSLTLFILSVILFRALERDTRGKGTIDMTTAY